MIIKISCQAIIEGEKFTPEVLSIPQTIRVVEKYTKGDVINVGRYKGNLSSEGLLIVDGDIDEIFQFIALKILPQFTRELVKLNLCILVCFEGECNFELTANQLIKIYELKIPLSITCYSR